MKMDEKTKNQVMEMLENYAKAYSNKDSETLLSYYSTDPELIMIGTGVDEIRQGISELKSQLSRDFNQVDGISCKFGNLVMSNNGPVAWVYGNITLNVSMTGKTETYNGRFTMVLENQDGKFLIKQSHFSLPYPTQVKGQSWPVMESGKILEPISR